ncbi:MAG: lipopolysaccharide heptosyltransferase II [Candidatus Omnitrophica bacterium]|nr:lipopolysaccharide heptosyltransferase II [Candidatus Omnitrophota bacterium]
MIKKILFVTLSNIGDVVLTLPVLDYLKSNFPDSKITVIVGPRPAEIFKNNPNIAKLIIYDKELRLRSKIKLLLELRKESFDFVVDLRNSFFGFFIPAKYKSSFFVPESIKHMRDRHFYKIKAKIPELENKAQDLKLNFDKKSLYLSEDDEKYIIEILRQNNIAPEDKIVVISAGARSHTKRWPKEKFSELVGVIGKEFKVKIILVGDKDEAVINKYILEHAGYPVVDLSAKTNLGQLGCLIKKAKLLVTNDSASLHLASYLDIAVVAIFGPTNDEKYGPWSEKSVVAKREIFCRSCEEAQCRFGTLECLLLVKVEDVMRRVREILTQTVNRSSVMFGVNTLQAAQIYKRILIVRTDRIGDVLLSTPVIKAIRAAYPNAYIAMMVSPYAREIVEGNPDLDEVIIYDKDIKHKSWKNSIKFSQRLRKIMFDLALILHPTSRVHLLVFFARIHKRVGYDRKLGFLLTDRITHVKQFGERHESDYALDLVRYLGIQANDKSLFMPIKPESERWVNEVFNQMGIKDNEKLLAIHSAASCPSKIWPVKRFAELADKMIEKYGFKVLVVAGAKDASLARGVIKLMKNQVIDLAGKTSVSQLASVLKRCQLFVSNDSGPVHIASAVGTPVISIFGRNQKGLSPVRWGPVGAKDQFLHKEVGCIECLAHNCKKEFACLKAITVEDVLSVVDAVLL